MIPADNGNIFYRHLLQPLSLQPQQRISEAELWPSVFLLCCFILLVIIKIRAYPRLVKIVQSTYSAQTLQQLEREDTNQYRLYGAALAVFFMLNLSFLAYKLNLAQKFVLVQSAHLTQFLFFVLLVSLLYAFKLVTNRLLAFVSGEIRLIQEYEISSALIAQACGLFLFPWIVLVELGRFYPLFFISGALITLLAALVIKWYRGVIISLVEQKVGLLQIFSYFCGLEILPIIVLVKYVIETF